MLQRSTERKVLRGQHNQCPSCLEYFATNKGFDKHRRGDYGVNRHCLSADGMKAKGMRKDAVGFWRLDSVGFQGAKDRILTAG